MIAYVLAVVAALLALGGLGCALSCWREAREYGRSSR